jgi:class 3 adenylate cyclase
MHRGAQILRTPDIRERRLSRNKRLVIPGLARGARNERDSKLAAILVADVVGYSRLTGADEDRILARLRTLPIDLIDPAISTHHGRIVKHTGTVR